MKIALSALACLLITAAAVALQSVYLMPNHDNDWLMLAAERVLAGGSYRTAFAEPVPPLILFLKLPAVLFAHGLSIGLYTSFCLYVGALILLSATLAAPYLRWVLRPEGASAEFALVGYVGVLALQPGYEFGQREHLALVLVLPGLLWFAAREAELPVRLDGWAVLALVLAAVGSMIKPFFLLLPVALLGLRLVRRRDWRILLDPSIAILLVVGLAYTAVVAFAYPEYFEEARMQRQVYFVWNRAWLTVLADSRESVAALLLALVLILLVPMRAPTRTVLVHLVVAGAVFLVLVMVQKKAWNYHLLPVVQSSLIGLMLVACILLPRVASRPGEARLPGLVLLAAILAEAGVLLFRPATELIFASRSYYVSRTPLLQTLPRIVGGRSYLMLTSGYQWGIPTMVGGTMAARGPGQIFLPGTVALSQGNAEERARAEALRPFVIAQLVEDLEKLRPHVVAVDRRMVKQAMPVGYDILTYYQSDESFVRAWSRYSRVESIRGWDFYQRNED